MTSTTTQRADASMAGFEKTTSRWGRITMLVALVLSLCGPAYLVFFADLGVTTQQILTAYAAVAGTFLIFALVEPVTYFPILGQAAMYQAFMIGNISNKLLPAAIVAQDRIGVRPGTRKGDLAAVMAICGAALVHLTSLLIFVGVLGTWLLSLIPAEVTVVARSYILPAILGAVLVQAIATVKQVRTTVVSLVVGGALVLVCIWAKSLAPYATALGVLLTIVISWVARDRHAIPVSEAPTSSDEDPGVDGPPVSAGSRRDSAGIA